MPSLYEPHPAALTTLYGDLENFARAQRIALPGTPGSVLERRNAGGYKFYAHQFYDATGRKVEKYIAGPVGDAGADAKAEELREKIKSLGETVRSIRLLTREGFKFVDSKTYATVASLHNHELFKAGASLVGSHAYGALLNQLGVRAAQYATKDVDIARNAQLAFEAAPQLSFLEMLKSSGISFFEVPGLNKRKLGTSLKNSHATALPYLRYLLGDSQETAILAREGCCMVRVPTPERFALHKLIVSQLRKGGGKAIKDLDQASVLFAVLADRHPGALADAAKAVPLSARKHVAKAAVLARQNLASHPRAIEALDAILDHRANKQEN
jgi:hypothetical protein